MAGNGPFGLGGDSPEERQLTDYEKELVDKVAKKVVRWKMTVPAIMALETAKPLNYIGSQGLVFFEPIVQSIFNFKDYDTFQTLLERRQTIEDLLIRIEHFDAIDARREKLFKKLKKEHLKSFSFGKRLWTAVVGFSVPKELQEEWKAKLDALDEPKDVEKIEEAEK